MIADGWIPNPGHVPAAAAGRRVRVMLAVGREAKETWPADSSRWDKSGHPFDIDRYIVL